MFKIPTSSTPSVKVEVFFVSFFVCENKRHFTQIDLANNMPNFITATRLIMIQINYSNCSFYRTYKREIIYVLGLGHC